MLKADGSERRTLFFEKVEMPQRRISLHSDELEGIE